MESWTTVIRQCRLDGIHMLEDMGCVLEGLGIPLAKAPYHRNLGVMGLLLPG